MRRIENPASVLVAAALVIALAGCGGGSKEDTQTANNTPAQTPAQTPPATTPPVTTPPVTTPAPTTQPPKSEPKSDPKPAPPKEAFVMKVVTVPAGTPLHICLQNTLSTENEIAGQAFDATTKGNVQIDGANAIPEGSTVKGNVTLAKRAPKVGGKAQMVLEVNQLTTPDGKNYRLFAEPLTLEGESTTTGDVEKVVGGTVGGAIIGGILGGKKGAIKGAAGGAAVGGVWAVATRGKDIVLDPNQEMEFHLAREIGVTAKIPTNAIP